MKRSIKKNFLFFLNLPLHLPKKKGKKIKIKKTKKEDIETLNEKKKKKCNPVQEVSSH